MVRYPKTRVSRMVTMLLTQSRLLRRVRNKSYLASFWHAMDRGDHRGISNRCHSMPGERAWCVDWGRGRMAFPLFAGENKKTVCSCKIRTHCFFGTPGGTRTPNPQNRNLMRYPLRYWRIAILTCQVIIAGETGIVKENFDEFQKKFLGRNFGKKTEGDLLPAGFRDRVNW